MGFRRSPKGQVYETLPCIQNGQGRFPGGCWVSAVSLAGNGNVCLPKGAPLCPDLSAHSVLILRPALRGGDTMFPIFRCEAQRGKVTCQSHTASEQWLSQDLEAPLTLRTWKALPHPTPAHAFIPWQSRAAASTCVTPSHLPPRSATILAPSSPPGPTCASTLVL